MPTGDSARRRPNTIESAGAWWWLVLLCVAGVGVSMVGSALPPVTFIVAPIALTALLAYALRAARDIRNIGLLIATGFFFVAFGVRPVFLLMRPLAYEPTPSVSAKTFESALATAVLLAVLGAATFVAAWRVGVASPSKRRDAALFEIAGRGLVVAAAIGAASGLYLLSRAGGLVGAFGRVRVVRTELEGELYPLFGTWILGAACLLVLAQGGSRRQIRLAWLGLAAMSFVSLSIGSRGSAIPPLLAGLVLSWASPYRKMMSRSGRGKYLLLGAALAVSLTAYGAFKNNAGIQEGDFGGWIRATVSNVTSANAIDQFNEVDYFAFALSHRETMPSGGDLASRVIRTPTFVLPRFTGITKPVPYDFDVRAAVVGGVPRTGLPASLFGELWLIGGVVMVVGAAGLIGLAFGRVARGLVDPSGTVRAWSAMVVGHVYLVLSRPLVVSGSRIIAYGLAFLVARSLIARLGPAKPARALAAQVSAVDA